MIDWDKSAELNGCTVKYLKKRFDKIPETNWLVTGVCDLCGSTITERKANYSDLCLKCKDSDTKKSKSRQLKTEVESEVSHINTDNNMEV